MGQKTVIIFLPVKFKVVDSMGADTVPFVELAWGTQAMCCCTPGVTGSWVCERGTVLCSC